MSEITKHWTSEILTLFGVWLWEKKYFGHGLLCISGPQWGYKIGQQLSIIWDNIMHSDGDDFNLELYIDDSSITPRYISEMTKEYLNELYGMKNVIEGGESIYLNNKTGRALSSSTLNRELKKFSEEFLREMEDKLGWKLNLKPLKSNAFQIAWALKMLEKYHYSKKCFVEVSRFMGHKSLKHTINLLEIEPFDDIVFDFHGVNSEGGLTPKVLDDSNEISRIFRTAEFDSYSQFKSNIA